MARGDAGVAERAQELAERAMAYAQGVVEGAVMPSWDEPPELSPALDRFKAGVIDKAGLDAEVAKMCETAEVADQEYLAAALARAFVVGWEARGEELGRRGRALGGVADDLRRGKRRHATAPRRPSRRDSGGDS